MKDVTLAVHAGFRSLMLTVFLVGGAAAGLYGGHLSNPVVTALCAGLTRRGINAVAFNWRGVGMSGGRVSGDPGIAAADYAAALAYVKASTPSALPWVAAGYSFGAATALRIAAIDPTVG